LIIKSALIVTAGVVKVIPVAELDSRVYVYYCWHSRNLEEPRSN